MTNGVREGDQVSLVSSSGTAWWSARMEAGRGELMGLLKRLDGRLVPDNSPDKMSDWEAMRIWTFNDPDVSARVARRFEQYGAAPQTQRNQSDLHASATSDPLVRAKASEVYFQSVARSRITLGVLERMLNSLIPTKGRKSVILVSDGFIYDTNMDEFKDVTQASRRANAAVYFVDASGLGGLPDSFSAEFGAPIDARDVGSALLDSSLKAEGSEAIASDSGGFSVKNTNDLNRGIQRIADEAQSYYLLGYNPTNTTPDGRFRKITVKSAQKGCRSAPGRATTRRWRARRRPRTSPARPTPTYSRPSTRLTTSRSFPCA
jgi:VWFA-related protein